MLKEKTFLAENGMSMRQTLVLTAGAGVMAELVTYPLDLLKTRQQARDFAQLTEKVSTKPLAASRRDLAGMIKNIVQNEGFLKLWDGVTPAIIRQIGATGVRTTLYEKMRDDVFGKDMDKKFPLKYAVLASWFSGAVSQVLINPTDLIKILLQTEGQRRVLGKQVRVTTASQALRLIVKKSGVRGLWRGWVISMHVSALTSVAGLTTYDICKQVCTRRFQLSDNYPMYLICSLVTSYVTTAVITPADMIKTRIMDQNPYTYKTPEYTSVMDCVTKVVKTEGFWALYAGFWPSFLRLTPWYLVFWISYEHIRQLLGKDSF